MPQKTRVPTPSPPKLQPQMPQETRVPNTHSTPLVPIPSPSFPHVISQNIQTQTPVPYTLKLMTHIYNDADKRQNIDALLMGSDKDVWDQSLTNEWTRLAQGLPSHNIDGPNTLHFIPYSKVPKGKKVTYANFVCDKRPRKKETH
mmetsp:Transcript_17385/g.24553  ORF Transcript_17385/g.24553 Transcript_17385/m.24553 type:complete len:145 (+) Transcript_17385:555-989(+)